MMTPSHTPTAAATRPTHSGVARAATCSAFLAVLVAMLAGCGQKGDLYIPDTPPAAQRATLPQTIFGGSRKDKTGASPSPAHPDEADTPDTDTDIDTDSDDAP